MSKPKITLIIPSLTNQSPTKALIILANNLCEKFDITVISFKKDLQLRNKLFANVTFLCFYNPNFTKILINFSYYFSNNPKSICISYGFSSDLICRLFYYKIGYLISSLRGTLYELYPLKYGRFLGKLISFVHNFLICKSNLLIVMNEPSLKYYSKIFNNVIKINNFIDEKNIRFKNNQILNSKKTKINFVFLGSLTKNKGVFELIDVFSEISNVTNEFVINFLGDTPNMHNVSRYAKNNLIHDNYNFHGFVQNPFNFLIENDYLIQPSFSEGQSRSVIESLFLGLPVIIRKKIAENLVVDGVNGYIFNNKNELTQILLKIIKNKIIIKNKNNLLPDDFRSNNVINKYSELLKNIKI